MILLSSNTSQSVSSFEIKQTIGNLTFVSYPYRNSGKDGKFCLKRIDVVDGVKADVTEIAFPNYLCDYSYGVLTDFTNLEVLSLTVDFGRLGNFFCDHSVNLNTENHDDIIPASLHTVNILGGRDCSSVDQDSFRYLTHVKTINIGKNIKTISKYAFRDLDVEHVNIQCDSGFIIRENAFQGCLSLTSVVIDNQGSMEIKYSAFEDCTSLREFTYNTNYPVVFGNDCFWNTNLESFIISSGSTLGTTMLGSCKNLRYVYVSSSTTITLNGSGNSPFTKCRENPTGADSNIILTIYTDYEDSDSINSSEWCENWNDTSHSSDPKGAGDERIVKLAPVVYNMTLEDFIALLQSE